MSGSGTFGTREKSAISGSGSLRLGRTRSCQLLVPLGLARTQPVRLLVPPGLSTPSNSDSRADDRTPGSELFATRMVSLVRVT